MNMTMRYALAAVSILVVLATVAEQPTPKPKYDSSKILFFHPFPHSEYVPADELKKGGAYFRLNVLGFLKIWDKIDSDPRVLEVYTRHSGVEIGAGPDGRLVRGFELYLGTDAEITKAAKELDGKYAIAEGDLVIVHGPTQTLFGTGLEGTTLTEYAHAPPHYVIKVRRLSPAPSGVPNVNDAPYIKIEVKGILTTEGKNPSLRDISDGPGWPSTAIRTDQCNLLLFLGKDDKWLARAKELNGKLAVARGELIDVGRARSKLLPEPAGISPLPFYLLDVADLQAAPAGSGKKP